MKILIVGPGALGCRFAVHLSRSKQDVWLLAHNKARAAKLKRQGIKEEGLCTASGIKVPVTTDISEVGEAELIVLCVKSYDTEAALKAVKGIIAPETYLLSIQNGMGNLQLMSEYADEARIIGGVTEEGWTLMAEGQARHAGKGETIIGAANGKMRGRLGEIAKVLNKSGFSTKMTRDINALIWSKLIVNVGVNALTAVTGLKNGMLLEYEGTRNIMRAAVAEAVKVAKRKRIKLIYDDPIQKVEAVCKNTAGNISSMLQDVVSRKVTEIDSINGAIVRQGKGLNIPTPVNQLLTDLVTTLQLSYKERIR